MDYGEYIQRLLLKHNVVLTELSQRIGLKSRNELYRLFYNQHSYAKAKAITDRIVETIDFTNEEKNTIYSLLKATDVKSSVIDARSILSRIFDEDMEPAAKAKQPSDSKTDVYLGSLKETERIRAAYEYILNLNGRVTLSHYVAFSGSEKDIARELYSVFLFSSLANYNVFLSPKRNYDGLCAVTASRTKNNVYMKIKSKRRTMTLDTEINDEMRDFIGHYFDLNKGRPIKKSNDKISEFPEMFKKGLVQFNSESVALIGGMYLCRIPYDILCGIFREAGYFGLPEDSEYVVNILKGLKKRWEGECSRRHKRRMIIDFDRLEEFIETGIPFDRIDGFRPLTYRERLKTLKKLQEDFDGSDGVKSYRFIKGRINRNIIYTKGHGITVYNSGIAYTSGNYYINIDTKKSCDVFDDFIEYIWQTRTYSDEDSRVMMRKLVLKAQRLAGSETA